MADIEIGEEKEGEHQWSYDVTVYDGGKKHTYQVTLSFQDYDHWSHGRQSPSQVVRAAFAFLLDREPAGAIMSRFDCSVIRRYFPEVDQKLPSYLGA